jgi:acylphosphatase
MHTARKYVVRGRVQGVGFRWFVENTANALGVKGWTRNLDDGSVEVYGVGTEEQHAELTARLWRGPSAARVEAVEQAGAEIEKLSGFSIRH